VPRDAAGRSQYGMCAVNPSRVGKSFGEPALRFVVDQIARASGALLEIVNYNVEHWQYVVAGDVVNLETLTRVLNELRARKVDVARMLATQSLAEVARQLSEAIERELAAVRALRDAAAASGGVLELTRGDATVPLPGIDVPFHSHFLRSGVAPFRAYLAQRINPADVDVALLSGKYVPNLVAVPFRVDREYAELVHATCGSPRLARLLRRWPKPGETAAPPAPPAAAATSTEAMEDDEAGPVDLGDPAQRQLVGYTILIELLAYQFASPVRWIETQDYLFGEYKVERLVEIGPGPTLSNMAARTLKFKYEAADEATTLRRELLCYTRDRAAIYYEDEAGAPAPPAAPAAGAAAAGTPKQPAPAAIAAPAPAPAPAAMPRVATGAPVPDAPIQPIEIVHALAAAKLKKPLAEVPLGKAIKDLVGGKSTLQNELLGDLHKEFGGPAVEKAEDLPLAELAAALQQAGGGPALRQPGPVGPVTSALVSRMLSAKLPGGFGAAAARNHLAAAWGLGPHRTEGVLLVALTLEPAARLANEAAARQWLDAAATAYSQHYSLGLGPTAAASADVAAAAAPAVVVGPPVAVPDQPVRALEVLQVLVAAKLKRRVDDVPPETTLKAVAAGKSTLQNELLGDIQKELAATSASALGDNAADSALADLAASPTGAAYTGRGPVSAAMIARLVSSKMPGGVTLPTLRARMEARWALGPGRQDGVLLHALTLEPPVRLADEAAAMAWLDETVADYARVRGVPLTASPAAGSTAAGAAAAAAVGGAPVSSAALTQFEKRQDAHVRDQIQLLAQFIGLNLREGHHLAEAAASEAEELRREVERWRNEHGDKYADGIRAAFDPRKARHYDAWWNWARQEALVLYYDILFGRLRSVDRETVQRAIALMNRAYPALTRLFDRYMAMSRAVADGKLGRPPAPAATGPVDRALYEHACVLGIPLADNVREMAAAAAAMDMAALPRTRDVSVPTAPSTTIDEHGQLRYSEVPRANVRKMEDYVREMKRGNMLTLVVSPMPDLVRASHRAVRRLAQQLATYGGNQRLQRRLRSIIHELGGPVRVAAAPPSRRAAARHAGLADDRPVVLDRPEAAALVAAVAAVSAASPSLPAASASSTAASAGGSAPRSRASSQIGSPQPPAQPAAVQADGATDSRPRGRAPRPAAVATGSATTTTTITTASNGSGAKAMVPVVASATSPSTRWRGGRHHHHNGTGPRTEERRPLLYLMSESAAAPGGWDYDPQLTALYFDGLMTLAKEGLSFAGKTALVTGCGRGSIGAEMVSALLAGGATVIATTSSFSAATANVFRAMYERHGARDARLILVPFNAASIEDTRALVDYIYDDRAGGLGRDLDFVLPFAALSENGREITDIDGHSELAHRMMLTNVLRLLGAIKTQKAARGFDTRPAHVLLPLSPNHGVFGGDGLYAESKLGLETLFNRWHSESWGRYDDDPCQWHGDVTVPANRGQSCSAASDVIATCPLRAQRSAGRAAPASCRATTLSLRALRNWARAPSPPRRWYARTGAIHLWQHARLG